MRSLSRKYLDDIILELANEYGVGVRDLESMINSMFKFFLRKMTDMNDKSVINMSHFGKFIPGQVALRNKSRWVYINKLLEYELNKRNIKYDIVGQKHNKSNKQN
jgi:hypothetical protein